MTKMDPVRTVQLAWEQERLNLPPLNSRSVCSTGWMYYPFGEYKLPLRDAIEPRSRAKVEEFADILVASGRFRVHDNVVPFVQRSMPVYDLPASAGTGVFLDSSEYEMVPVGAEVPVNANFGVRVSGDSMEPSYHDQQVVWVQQQPTLMDGDIGIFVLNGQAYIKQWQSSSKGTSLISLNPAYSPIPIHESDELRTFGKVLS